MDTLIASVLGSLMRRQKPAPGALSRLGEQRPESAASALLDAASLPELAATRSSWVPALLVSARPGRGARLLHELAGRHGEVCGEVLDPARMPSLALVLGSSELLGRILLRNPQRVAELIGDPPPPPDLHGCVSAHGSGRPTWEGIREASYRGLLRLVARELLGCPLQESLAEFSHLADDCLESALECASLETGIAPPAMLALGQLGGRELSMARQVELLFLAAEADETRGEAARLVGHLVGELGRAVPDGALYSVRTGPRAGPRRGGGVPVYGVSDALALCTEGGAEQRCELLRVRQVAGPEEVGRRFIRGITPFVFPSPGREGRGAPSRGALETARRSYAGAGREHPSQATCAERDLHDGPGGIAAVEAFVHTLQLEHGGREPAVRSPNVLNALAALRRSALLDEESARLLTDSYAWLRRAEHFLQLVNERPTREFPSSPDAQRALARCMGYREPDGQQARQRLLVDWRAVRGEVAGQLMGLIPEVGR